MTEGQNVPHDAEPLLPVRLAAELAIKSRRTRAGFQRRLLANLRDALRTTGAPFRVEPSWGRVWVRTGSAESLAVLPRVFGVSSLSPVDVVVPAELDAIVSAGEAAFRERVQGKTRSEEHTSELQSREKLVCRLLLEKKNKVPANW